jgi:hypothetical protein
MVVAAIESRVDGRWSTQMETEEKSLVGRDEGRQ